MSREYCHIWRVPACLLCWGGYPSGHGGLGYAFFVSLLYAAQTKGAGKMGKIEFRCSHCGNEMCVSKEKAGLYGKCPKCLNVFRIPERSDSEVITFENNAVFKSEKLNRIYSSFLANNDNLVINQHIAEDQNNAVGVLTLITEIGRSQILCFFYFELEGQGYLLINSLIGIISDMESAIYALRNVDKYQSYSLSLDDENCLSLSCARMISTSAFLFAGLFAIF
jgi:phage FluMu protein Com